MAWWSRLFRGPPPASLEGQEYRIAFTLLSQDGEREATVHELRDGYAYIRERERIDGEFQDRHDGRLVGPFPSPRAAERFITSSAWFVGREVIRRPGAISITTATLLLFLALLLGAGEIMAIADPVGTKMADDADPFGDPHISWPAHAAALAVVIALVGGAWLLLRPRKTD